MTLLLGAGAAGAPSFDVLTSVREGIAWGVDGDGDVVVGWREDDSGGLEAFRWALGAGDQTLLATFAAARDVSDDGNTVVGYSRDAFNTELAWRWTPATGAEIAPWPVLTMPLNANAEAVSRDGLVTIGSRRFSQTGSNFIARTWTGDTFVTLWSSPSSFARATNHDGSIVGGDTRVEGNQRHACFWVGPDLDDRIILGVLASQQGLDFVNSFVQDMSADGSVIVGSSGNSAFRWTQATGMVEIPGLPGATITEAYACSADGNVVVGRSIGGTPGPQSFVWTPEHGTRNLVDVLAEGAVDVSPWFLTAYDVSSDGTTVVGVADNGPTGYPFIAVIAPRCVPAYDVTADGHIDAEDVYQIHASPQDVTGDSIAEGADRRAIERCVRRAEATDALVSR
ncbi:MAG: hypothetical protein Tsb0013_05730 [Phycisphaerales bacterium]